MPVPAFLAIASFQEYVTLVTANTPVSAGVMSITAGLSVFAAIVAKRLANWVRADLVLAAVGLYAVLLGRLHVFTGDEVNQMLAYTLGFVLASLLEPVTRYMRSRKGRADTEG